MHGEFFIIALTILIGFLSSVLFERTRISQVIILMLFGFLLGPVLGFLDVSSESIIVSILPFIATLALIVLLFDGGLELNIFAVARAIPKSMLYTFLVFLLSIFLITFFLVFAFGWPVSHSLLLGAVVGGTSSAVVIALVEKTGTKKETKSMLTVESTMTDALCIITAVIIAELIVANQAPEAGFVASLLLSQFTIAITFGLLAAFVWIFIIDRVTIVQEYTYMLMLSIVFGLYAITEFVRGNGGIAVFVFGIIIGNARKIAQFAKFEWENPITRTTKLFQEEVTFFVRTFFFTYIGLLLSLEYFSLTVILVGIGILALVTIARLAIQKVVMPDLSQRDKYIVVSMMPRGLAAAVLATIPITKGIPMENFQEIVFGVLLLSNVVATAGIFLFDKEEPTKFEHPPAKLKEPHHEKEKPKEEAKPKKNRKKKQGKKS
jgi:cell volume regulation protein A